MCQGSGFNPPPAHATVPWFLAAGARALGAPGPPLGAPGRSPGRSWVLGCNLIHLILIPFWALQWFGCVFYAFEFVSFVF